MNKVKQRRKARPEMHPEVRSGQPIFEYLKVALSYLNLLWNVFRDVLQAHHH